MRLEEQENGSLSCCVSGSRERTHMANSLPVASGVTFPDLAVWSQRFTINVPEKRKTRI